MRAEILTIGDELLIGQTIDTNSAWMGSEMSQIGFDVWRITSIHDNRQIRCGVNNRGVGTDKR